MPVCHRFVAALRHLAPLRRASFHNRHLTRPGHLFQGAFFIWLLCSGLLTSRLHAQTGSWAPAGADLSYPRTLLKGQDLEQVRENLGEPVSQALYTGLYTETQNAAPSDNTSAAGRRARAAFAKNAAFVVLLARQPAEVGLAPLPAAERAALAATTR